MTTKKSTPNPSFTKGGEQKKAMIAKIKIAQKQLGLDDGAYRDILKRVTGKTSSTQLTEPQLEAVINELKRYGFKPTAPAKHGRKPNIGEAHASRKVKVGKIEALLADMGKHWNYAHSIAKKVTKGEKLNVDFCSDSELTKIISALTRTQQYQKKKQVTPHPASPQSGEEKKPTGTT